MSGGAAPATERKKRIVLVEDDDEIRSLLQRVLSRRYQVLAAPEGEFALLAAKKVPPDLFILDIALPGVDGLDLASLINSDPRLHRVPLVFITAMDTPETQIRGIQAGARHFITKPFNISEVMDKISRILG